MTLTIIALFRHVDTLRSAEKSLRKCGAGDVTVMSPVPVPVPVNDKTDYTTGKSDRLKYLALIGGLAGAFSGSFFALWTSIVYPLPRAGRAIAAFPPVIIISFETLILFGMLATFIGFLIKAGLPALHERPYHAGIGIDRFGLLINMEAGKRDSIENLLREEGVEEIVEVTDSE